MFALILALTVPALSCGDSTRSDASPPPSSQLVGAAEFETSLTIQPSGPNESLISVSVQNTSSTKQSDALSIFALERWSGDRWLVLGYVSDGSSVLCAEYNSCDVLPSVRIIEPNGSLTLNPVKSPHLDPGFYRARIPPQFEIIHTATILTFDGT